MKVVILAGGYGTRISEETGTIPKPLVEIGAMPILWHITKIYSAHGLNDFVICLGYKGQLIKEYFLNYFHRANNLTIDLANNSVQIHNVASEPWRVTLKRHGDRFKNLSPFVQRSRSGAHLLFAGLLPQWLLISASGQSEFSSRG